MSQSPIAVLYRNLGDKRHRVAIRDDEVELCYGELIDRVERAAFDLTRRSLAGKRIGLCAANTWQNIVAYLAILRVGAVWVPINPNNGALLNSALMARANLALALCDKVSAESLGEPGAEVLMLDTWLDGALPTGALPAIEEDPSAPFAIKFTGGSTGVPKGVVQTLRSANAALASLEAFYGLQVGEVNLVVAPLSHGASHYILPVLAAGATHVVLSRPDRAAILAELKARVSVVFMPPTLIRMLLNEGDFAPDDFPSLRHLTYSAAPMAVSAIDEAIGRFGPVLSTLYGQTEAPMAISALMPAQMLQTQLRTSVGFAFPGVEIALLTENGEIGGQGAVGEILVKGDLADTYYLDQPELTEAARHMGWLRTGDIGRIAADGSLSIVGRAKEMIITGGYNVYLAEVEQTLVAHPAVIEACAFGVEDSVWGERLEVAVVARAEVEALRLFLREKIGPVRTPKQFHLLETLPRNPVGKVVRGQVKALFYPIV